MANFLHVLPSLSAKIQSLLKERKRMWDCAQNVEVKWSREKPKRAKPSIPAKDTLIALLLVGIFQREKNVQFARLILLKRVGALNVQTRLVHIKRMFNMFLTLLCLSQRGVFSCFDKNLLKKVRNGGNLLKIDLKFC